MGRRGRRSRGGKGNVIGPTPALTAAECSLCHVVKGRDQFSKTKWRQRKCIDCVQGQAQQQHSHESTAQERINLPLRHSRSQQRTNSSSQGRDLEPPNTLGSTPVGDDDVGGGGGLTSVPSTGSGTLASSIENGVKSSLYVDKRKGEMDR